jgi:hypothetical protein
MFITILIIISTFIPSVFGSGDFGNSVNISLGLLMNSLANDPKTQRSVQLGSTHQTNQANHVGPLSIDPKLTGQEIQSKQSRLDSRMYHRRDILRRHRFGHSCCAYATTQETGDIRRRGSRGPSRSCKSQVGIS